MANALFDISREKFLSGALSWSSDDIRCCLVRGYTYSAAHTTLASVTGAGGTIVASSGAFTSKTVTSGVADAADVTFTAVGAGSAITSIIVYREGASDSARDLIAYLDTGTGLPVTPDGSDITIVWDGGANKIFKL
jgi:hypothetical protein